MVGGATSVLCNSSPLSAMSAEPQGDPWWKLEAWDQELNTGPEVRESLVKACGEAGLLFCFFKSSTLATSCKELTHWKRLWCWEGLGAGGGDDRGWDGWMASLTRWMSVWVNSGSWWWTGRPGLLRFMGLQRVGHDWATELNWRNICLIKEQLHL